MWSEDGLEFFPSGCTCDILVYSATLEDPIADVRAVLEFLLANHPFVKAEKCQFHQKAVSFLGYQISPQGVRMGVKKVDAVRSWPVRTTIKGLQCFLGFANFYYRFSSWVVPVGWCGAQLLTRPSV